MSTDTTDQHRSPMHRSITDSHAELGQHMIDDHVGRRSSGFKIRKVVGSNPTAPLFVLVDGL